MQGVSCSRTAPGKWFRESSSIRSGCRTLAGGPAVAGCRPAIAARRTCVFEQICRPGQSRYHHSRQSVARFLVRRKRCICQAHFRCKCCFISGKGQRRGQFVYGIGVPGERLPGFAVVVPQGFCCIHHSFRRSNGPNRSLMLEHSQAWPISPADGFIQGTCR